METLASRIEHQLQVGKSPYNVPRAPVYEHELKRFWPLNEEHRGAKIAQFAKQHGFRLRFYSKGLCAIFDKEPPKRLTLWGGN
jgi:hypothetical protein